MSDESITPDKGGHDPRMTQADGDGESRQRRAGAHQSVSTDKPDKKTDHVPAGTPPELCPTVAIGASAGGIEALKAFFAHVPADSGSAFVVILHISHTHTSHLAEVLASSSGLTASVIENGQPIRPNHIHTIPPNRVLVMEDNRLRLIEPQTPGALHDPIDAFFGSLARHQQQRAIAVILSGMGRDGTIGLRAIKDQGGVVFVQQPGSAQHGEMPQSAIDTGLADQVLPPEQLAQAVLGYCSHDYVRRGDAIDLEEIQDREQARLQTILDLVASRTGNDFRFYKKGTVLRRIIRRMCLKHIEGLESYLECLRDQPDEVQALMRDLMISVTGFFRDPAAWQALRDEVIVPLVRDHQDGTAIRAWVPACATGEEAYSLAIMLLEVVQAENKRCPIKLFATDTALDCLDVARAGVFPDSIASAIDPQRLDRFFEHAGGIYRIRKVVRDLIVFAPQNLTMDPPFSGLDLVSCRNLLIYLQPHLQKHVLGLLHFALRDGGHLFLGNAETVTQNTDLFDAVSQKWRIYRKHRSLKPRDFNFPLGPLEHLDRRMALTMSDKSPRQSMAILARQALAHRFAPPSVLIDHRMRVLFFHGRTERYLNQPQGEPTSDLLAMARQGLGTKLRSLVYRVINKGETDCKADVRIKIGEEYFHVTVSATQAKSDVGGDALVLVSFQEYDPPQPASAPADDGESEMEAALQESLRTTRDQLQGTIEELESSNEELKVSNEEVVSINEELQSTNEELETSKEELQSLNEELNTVNDELQAKVEQLEHANDDLNNLLSSTEVATIFLDTELRIRWFTPQVDALLNIQPSDVNRPLDHFARKFEDDRLLDDARAVLAGQSARPVEVRTETDEWYLRRVLPYYIKKDRINGVVITFVPVTDLIKAQAQLRDREKKLRLALEACEMGTWAWNPATGETVWDGLESRLIGMDPNDTTDKLQVFWDRVHPDDAARVRQQLETALAGGADYNSRFRIVLPGGETRWLAGRAHIIHSEVDNQRWMIGVNYDITEYYHNLEDAQKLARIVEYSHNAILSKNMEGVILSWNRGAQKLYGYTEAEAIGQNVSFIIPEDKHDELARIWRHLRAGKDVEPFETERVAKDGRRIRVRLAISPYHDGQGNLAGASAIALDITEETRVRRLIEESEKQFRAAIEQAPIPVIMYAEDGEVLQVNYAWTVRTGYTIDEMPTLDAWLSLLDETESARVRAVQSEIQESGKPQPRVEFKFVGPDGATSVWHYSVSSPGRTRDGRRYFVGIAVDVTDQKRFEAELLELNEQLEQRVAKRTRQANRRARELRRLSHVMLINEDRERKQIAMDLHDSLGQLLTVAKLKLGTLQQNDGLEAHAQALKEVEDLLGQANQSARSLTQQISPPVLYELGLVPSVEWLTEQTERLYGLHVPVIVEADPGDDFDDQTSSMLYRAIRELLVNVAKHAKTDRAEIVFKKVDNGYQIQVRDHGVGFNVSREILNNGGAGLGLFGIRERLEMIGGKLSIESNPKHGTLIRMTVPVPA